MRIISIAFFNVFRNTRRTAITTLSIIIASISIIVFGGFINFTFDALRESTIHTQIGHFQIATPGYFDKGAGLPVEFIMKDQDAVIELIKEVPNITSITKRLTGSCIISTGEITLTGSLVGVVPEDEEEFAYSETLVAGTQLEQGRTDQCVLGESIAKGLGVTVGSSVTILTTTFEGTINAIDCNVAGIVKTNAKAYDAVYIKIHLAKLQSLLDTEGAEKILILLSDTAFVKATEPLLKAKIKNLELHRWDQIAEFYAGVVNLYSSIFNFTAIILGLVVLLSIANTMSMSVFERFREIGTLRAMGETRASIMAIFISEGIFIGMIGSLLGALGGLACGFLINQAGGINVPPPPGMTSGYVAYIQPTTYYYIIAALTSTLASGLASLLPAFRASRLDIVKALQHN